MVIWGRSGSFRVFRCLLCPGCLVVRHLQHIHHHFVVLLARDTPPAARNLGLNKLTSGRYFLASHSIFHGVGVARADDYI